MVFHSVRLLGVVLAIVWVIGRPLLAESETTDLSKEFEGGIVPTRWIDDSEPPGHLMTAESMLTPYFEPVASGALEFKFSEKGLLGVLRSQRLSETIPASGCMKERDLIELLVYDHKRRKSYPAWSQQVEHSQRGSKRMVRRWGFHAGGIIFEVSTPELKKQGETARAFSIYWKKSATSSAPSKLIASYSTSEADFMVSGDESVPCVLFRHLGYERPGTIQVLDGSEPVPVPADLKNSHVFFTDAGRRLAIGEVAGEKKRLRVRYTFDLKTRKFEATRGEGLFKDYAYRQEPRQHDELRFESVAGQPGQASLYLVSRAKLDPRESARVRLYTGRDNSDRYTEQFDAAFSPERQNAAFIGPEADHTCYFVYWTLTPKWADTYPRMEAWWAAHTIMRGLEAYWRAADEAAGRDYWARENHYEVPPDPANSLRPYVTNFPGILDKFVFTKGPVEGIDGNYVGYYEIGGFRGYVSDKGDLSSEPPGCQPPDVVGAGAEAFDEF